MNKYRRGELAKEILRALAASGFLILMAISPGASQLYKMFNSKSAKERYRIQQTLKILDKKELIRLVEKNGQTLVEITTKGRSKILDYDFDELKIKNPKKWDNKWRLVIFDIPEDKRLKRVLVSKKLAELGFYQLQKSIYIYPYDCEEVIDFIRGYLNIDWAIKYLVASKMSAEDEGFLLDHFDL